MKKKESQTLMIAAFFIWIFSIFLPGIEVPGRPVLFGYTILWNGVFSIFLIYAISKIITSWLIFGAWFSNIFFLLAVLFRRKKVSIYFGVVGFLMALGSIFIDQLPLAGDFVNTDFVYRYGAYIWGLSWVLLLLQIVSGSGTYNRKHKE